MGCGCGKKKVVPSLPSSGDSTMATLSSPKTYDVLDSEGTLVASTTNLVFARVEARRVGGTVVPSTATSASSA